MDTPLIPSDAGQAKGGPDTRSPGISPSPAMRTAYAHSLPDRPQEEWQPLEQHLRNVAERAAEFAAAFGSEEWGWNAGWLHDIGKADSLFQGYLVRENGLDDGDYDRGRVNHSSAGAALSEEQFNLPNRPIGRPLAYIVAGHHAGLPDYYRSETGMAALEMRLQEGRSNLERIREDVSLEYTPNLRALVKPPLFVKREQFHLWVRMLFSCLADADFLDTEAFMQPQQLSERGGFSALSELKVLLDRHLDEMVSRSAPSAVNVARQEVLFACRVAAGQAPGMFSLTVPTGGGKTLSGMAFAVDHAIRHNKRRVIYVIPYTSIIEQTANILTGIFGRENIVEHHSNLDPDRETPRSRLATENWDAPIVITTNVQFFESLYAARAGRCRKLHNIADSVVILDEAQLLPAELLDPCVDAINQLVRHYGVTIVLATATQPALSTLSHPCPRLDDAHEIVPDTASLYARLKRTQVLFPTSPEPMSWEVVAERLQAHEQVLCVVNTRKDCHDLFRLMPEGTLHLSALMCGQHRSRVIAEIKQRLKDGEPSRVVSTQLIEAGVDLDFPVVYRAWAGLDSIAQSAGRCNREGRLNSEGLFGEVHVFVPPKPSRAGLLRKGEETTHELMALPGFDVGSPDIFSRYFALFYSRVNDTGSGILKDLAPSDSAVLDVSFRSVGQHFKLIKDDQQRPVFVRFDAVACKLIERLRFGGPTRDLLRRLQRYTVNLPVCMFERLARDIQEPWPDFSVWNGRYDMNVGVDVFGDGLSLEESVC